jgi:hypothetical protein
MDIQGVVRRAARINDAKYLVRLSSRRKLPAGTIEGSRPEVGMPSALDPSHVAEAIPIKVSVRQIAPPLFLQIDTKTINGSPKFSVVVSVRVGGLRIDHSPTIKVTTKPKLAIKPNTPTEKLGQASWSANLMGKWLEMPRQQLATNMSMGLLEDVSARGGQSQNRSSQGPLLPCPITLLGQQKIHSLTI